MSIGLCGYIDFSSDCLSELISLSYFIMEQSIRCRIGCKIGGNVSQDAYSLLENEITNSTILMEIMDTPLDNYAEDLCQPSFNRMDVSELDIRDKIKLNLCCLQEFLQSIIKYKKVNKIMLCFNYVFWQSEEKTVEISMSDFSDIMLGYYNENNYAAPELIINICRD